jgi:hypothetical protein
VEDRVWTNFENSFRPRQWKIVRNSWAAFVPLIDPPGSRPAITLATFLEDSEILVPVSVRRNQLTGLKTSRGEVPEIIFREAVYWLHKALYVLGASETHINTGLPTWSLTVAYQSAFFSARSIIGFLGVSVTEVNGVTFCGDICRDVQGIRPKRAMEMGAFDEEVSFYTIGIRFEHRHVWSLFQRILRVTSCDVWPDGWANYFAQLKVSEITKQRHGLHYRLTYWVEDDLYTFLHPDGFCEVSPSGNNRTLFDSERTNFSLTVALSITRLALVLFSDLCQITNRLSDESRLINECLSLERHPVFADVLKGYTGSSPNGSP